MNDLEEDDELAAVAGLDDSKLLSYMENSQHRPNQSSPMTLEDEMDVSVSIGLILGYQHWRLVRCRKKIRTLRSITP